MEVKKTMGMLTTALAAITTQVDHLSQGKASQAATFSAQPRNRTGESPTAAPSASFDPNTEEQVRMLVEHRAGSAHLLFLAITDDEMGGEEEERMPAPRKGPANQPLRPHLSSVRIHSYFTVLQSHLASHL